MSVVVVGLNQRTVPLELLERMTVSPARLPKALHDLAARTDIREVVVLSTCLRTEIYLAADRYHSAVVEARNFLSAWSGAPPEDFTDHLYTYFAESAATHLFEVASGLDSAVLGEGEILGQVRSAVESARNESASGPVLDVLFRHAIEVGKRARSETAISRGITSVSQAAVAMASERLGGLDGRSILVLGAGEMGEGMAGALAAAQGTTVLVANRTPKNAQALAARIGAQAIDLVSVPSALVDVDVLLTSTSSPGVLVEAADLAPVMATRPERPLLVVDIAVPRDVDPRAGELPGVTLLDAEDIRAFAEAGRATRAAEIDRVRRIVTDEVERWLASARAREVAPRIVALRERSEELRVAELDRHRNALAGLTEEQLAAVDALTRGLVAKVLHEPITWLKEGQEG